MKRSKLLLVSAIVGSAYLVYLLAYFTGLDANTTSDVIAKGLASAMVTPHMVCVGVAVIFNWLGWWLNKAWGALTAGILYAISIVCMFVYFMFVVVQMVLCFIAFGKMKK